MTPTPDTALTVETVTSVSEVPANVWDSLAPEDPMASHGWLQLMEEELGAGVETLYVLARQGEELVGALPCYLCYRSSRLLDPNQFMFGRFRRLPELLHMSFVPTMLLGPYFGVGSKFLLADSLDEPARQILGTRLKQKALDLARARGLSIQVTRISNQSMESLNALSEDRRHEVRLFPMCYLDIEWNDFEGYLSYIKSFSANTRRSIKKEINRFHRSNGLIRKLQDPIAHGEVLQRLIKHHYWRLNRAAFPFSDRFFIRLKELLGDEAIFYGGFLGESLVGFSLMLRRGGTAYMFLTGIDRDRTDNEGTYFNLCYYRPIMDAPNEGLQRLFYGTALHQPKVRRGCKIMNLSQWHLGTSPAWHAAMNPWFAFHSAWMRKRITAAEDLAGLRAWFGN